MNQDCCAVSKALRCSNFVVVVLPWCCNCPKDNLTWDDLWDAAAAADNDDDDDDNLKLNSAWTAAVMNLS